MIISACANTANGTRTASSEPVGPRFLHITVTEGVSELDQEKLTPLLRLKYHDSIADAVADLGRTEEIGRPFASFKKYLYAAAPA